MTKVANSRIVRALMCGGGVTLVLASRAAVTLLFAQQTVVAHCLRT